MTPLLRAHEFTTEEKRILFITCPCHFLTHFFILVFPAVTMPLVADLGIPLEDVVKLSFLMYLSFGVFALPVGLIVDRWRAHMLLVIGVFLMGTGLLLAGLFPSPKLFYVSLGVVGIGASVYHPAGMALISRTIRRRGYALGINGVWGNLGIASAPLTTGLLTWLFGWQQTFIILGAVGVLTSILLAIPRVDERSVETSRPAAGAEGRELVGYFLIMCAALVFGGLAYRGNMLLLPAYFELKTHFFNDFISAFAFLRTTGTQTLSATVLTSLVLLAGIFGQVIGGRLADRIDLRRAYLLVHGLSLPFLFCMAFASDYLLAVCAAGYVTFSLGMQPVENSLIAALTPERWRSTSYAIKFILNFGVGSTVVYLIAPIKHAFSLETVYIFLSGVTLLLVTSTIVLLIASRRLPSVRN